MGLLAAARLVVLTVALLAPTAMAVPAPSLQPPGEEQFTATYDKTVQKYLMLLPAEFDPKVEHDLLLAFHGHGADRRQFATDARGECQGARDVAARHGMILVSPDYRAPSGWMGAAGEADTVQLIGELRKAYKVKRVYLVGGSMGGAAVLTFTALHPDLVDGVVSLNGLANLLEYEVDLNYVVSIQAAIKDAFGGRKDETPAEYKRRNPAEYRKRSAEYGPGHFTMPLAVTIGRKDTLVPPQSVLRLAAAVKRHNADVLVIDRPEGGHETSLADTVAALEFVIGAAEKPGMKAAGVRGAIVLARASHPWMSQQIEEPCILPNPKVPGRLIMFYGAVSAADRVVGAIGKAWADARDPLRWHQDEANPIFRPSGRGWDSRTLRLDTVLYVPEEDAYYIYYSGSSGPVQDRIGLAISPAGTDGYSGVTEAAIRRYGTAPVLVPEPAAPYHEEMASQAAVLRERDAAGGGWNWYMYYSYRGKDGVLPGIRLAASQDGKKWTRHFNAADPSGRGQVFRSTPGAYYEWHQVLKVGATYVLCTEVGVDHGARWRPGLAVSTDPEKGWTQLDLDTVLQTKWAGVYDDRTIYHVATPALYEIGGKWYLFAQACGRPANDNYIDGAWEMWGFECIRLIPTRPGYAELHIPGMPGAAGASRPSAGDSH